MFIINLKPLSSTKVSCETKETFDDILAHINYLQTEGVISKVIKVMTNTTEYC